MAATTPARLDTLDCLDCQEEITTNGDAQVTCPGCGRVWQVPVLITADHCSSCGSLDSEDLETGDGYSTCCNKPVVFGGECDSRCRHTSAN